jgi:hypothetical protein
VQARPCVGRAGSHVILTAASTTAGLTNRAAEFRKNAGDFVHRSVSFSLSAGTDQSPGHDLWLRMLFASRPGPLGFSTQATSAPPPRCPGELTVESAEGRVPESGPASDTGRSSAGMSESVIATNAADGRESEIFRHEMVADNQNNQTGGPRTPALTQDSRLGEGLASAQPAPSTDPVCNDRLTSKPVKLIGLWTHPGRFCRLGGRGRRSRPRALNSSAIPDGDHGVTEHIHLVARFLPPPYHDIPDRKHADELRAVHNR